MDVAKYSAKVLPFPKSKTGILHHCHECHRPYRLPWRTGSIRDGRESLCPDCFLDVLIMWRGEYREGCGDGRADNI